MPESCSLTPKTLKNGITHYSIHLSFFQDGRRRPSWIWACTEKNDHVWKFHPIFFESYNHVEKKNTKFGCNRENTAKTPPAPGVLVMNT